MKAVTRVGASVCLTIFSLVCLILLLPSSRVGTQLQRITLGTTIDRLPDIWGWPSTTGNGKEDDVRVVAFGDSWVDDSKDGQKGRGRSWAEVLCEMTNCSSYLNYAASQPLGSHPASPPTGAIASNKIFISALANSASASPETLDSNLLPSLPDLEAQIQKFISRPPPSSDPSNTMFVVSFGFWDIYKYAALDYTLAQNTTDWTIHEIFNQLETLYLHYVHGLSSAKLISDATDATAPAETIRKFRVVIPKLLDPTLLPGWLSQRPVPVEPSTVAEIQKNAAYLTIRWNQLLENKVGEWMAKDQTPPANGQDESNDANTSGAAGTNPVIVEKDVFLYDLSAYLTDIILEHQLEDDLLTDGNGLGKGQSPFESVYQSCVREAQPGDEDGYVDGYGQLVCKQPEEYLFWDSFNLGCVANEAIGKEVGGMVRDGKSLRRIWKDQNKKWGG